MVQTVAERQSESTPHLRVILVGRSRLEQSVRRESAIELVRARTALDAVGEHGVPIAGGPDRTMVVLSDEQSRSEDAAELIRALRRVNARVKVVAVRGSGTNAGGPRAATDGTIDEDADAAALIALMDRLDGKPHNGHNLETPTIAIELDEPPTRTPEGAAMVAEAVATASGVPPVAVRPIAPVAAPTPAAAPIAAPAMPINAPLADDAVQADIAILHTLLAGDDIQSLCVARAQQSSANGPILFHPSGSETTAPTPPDGFAREAVVHRDSPFGWLVGPKADNGEELLRQRAEWLAHWLALREQHRQLCTAAFTDALTGAWNRRYFDRFLDGAIKEAKRRRHVLTVLVFDIDDFKRYNDQYGHPVGDDILIETVRLLRSVVRPHDKVCRIGGDEFAVVFYEPEGPREAGSQHPAEISQIARRFQSQVATARFPKLGSEFKGRLTISGGLATYPWDGGSPEALLSKADALSLESKRQGKNVICFGAACSENGVEGSWKG